MNPSADLNDGKPARRSWAWIAGTSALVSIFFVGLGWFVPFSPVGMVAVLFAAGAVAGAVSSRQAWLSGIIVGLPFLFAQWTRQALLEFLSVSAALTHPDYWIVVLPAAVVSTGVAILGGLSGAYLFGDRFRPR